MPPNERPIHLVPKGSTMIDMFLALALILAVGVAFNFIAERFAK